MLPRGHIPSRWRRTASLPVSTLRHLKQSPGAGRRDGWEALWDRHVRKTFDKKFSESYQVANSDCKHPAYRLISEMRTPERTAKALAEAGPVEQKPPLSPVLDDLRAALRKDTLAQHAQRLSPPAGQSLFNEGAPCQGFPMLPAGKVPVARVGRPSNAGPRSTFSSDLPSACSKTAGPT